MSKATKNDNLVTKLKEKVAIQEAALGKPPRRNWVTTCSFVFPNKDRVNIQTCTDMAAFISVAGLLKAKEAQWAAGINALSLDYIPFKYDEFTVDEWLQDIKQRVALIEFKAKEAKLKKLKSQLHQLTSEEARRAEELEAIAAELE